MKLLIKFNLVLILVFGTGMRIAGCISRNFLERTAREEVLQQARLMMGAAGGMRSYTSQQIVPLLQAQQARIKAFLPQTVPAFSATEVFSLTGREDIPAVLREYCNRGAKSSCGWVFPSAGKGDGRTVGALRTAIVHAHAAIFLPA